MADVKPLRALRYDTTLAGPLSQLTAPPYDVITAEDRIELLGRSEYNVVAIDLPVVQVPPAGSEAERRDELRPYEEAGARFEDWQKTGILKRDRVPAFWAHSQEYTGPDGVARTRRGFFCRVHLEDYGAGRIRPHERTHPGPKEDRLRLMRATRADLSPIFALYSDPSHSVWDAIAPAAEETPSAEVTDREGTVHRLWQVSDPETIAIVQRAMRDAELLIADGHHRYETANAYAKEIGEIDGHSEHEYVLMCLVALDDPGLSVFPTHRLIAPLQQDARDALREAIANSFEIEDVSLEQLPPPPGGAPAQFGYIDSRLQPLRLTLRSQASADAALRGHSEAYRRLDTGVLEALLLRGALQMSDEDIEELRLLRYSSNADEAISLVRSGEVEAAFLMRPTPISQVRDVAASGESMPPKSTFFYPKLLTGLLFNPLG